MNILLIIIPIVFIIFITIVVIFLLKKKKNKSKVETIEDYSINLDQELMTEPLTPLGSSIIDKEFEGLPVESVTSNISQNELVQEEIQPVFNLNIDAPITAQEKGVIEREEKKEVETKIDVFKECPVCHTKVEPTAAACFLCGAKLD